MTLYKSCFPLFRAEADDSDYAAFCDPSSTSFQGGKCVSTVEITSDNESVRAAAHAAGRNEGVASVSGSSFCDPSSTSFQGGKCVSTVEITSDNESVRAAAHAAGRNEGVTIAKRTSNITLHPADAWTECSNDNWGVDGNVVCARTFGDAFVYADENIDCGAGQPDWMGNWYASKYKCTPPTK